MEKKCINSRFQSGSAGNLLKKMKLLFAFFFAGLLGVSASTYSQQTKLSMKLDEATVKEAFKQIESKSEFVLFYNEDIVNVNRKVSIDVTDQNVENILTELFNGTDNTFKIYDRQIVISSLKIEGLPQKIKSEVEQPQKKSISGKVTDEKGQTLPGASVVVKGTTIGIVTDSDGNYTLAGVPGNAVLQFSFVGMKTQEIVMAGKTSINVTLAEESLGIEEVVATALGITREKKALGYAVQEVKGEVFEKSKELDINNSLNGRVAGVFVSQGRENLGSANSRIVIRGETSISGNNTPLYIVDGFPSSFANPNDIESLTVLKGPAATALYGSRASAGVIVITTKSGKKTKGVSIELNSSFSMDNPSVLPDYQAEYGQGLGNVYSSSQVNSWGPAFTGPTIQQLWGGNEWQAYKNNVKNFYETGNTYNNNIAISSSDEISDFRLSFNNVNQTGMIPNTKFNEQTIDLNTRRKLTDKLEVRANVKFKAVSTPNNSNVDPRLTPLNVNFDALKNYWNSDTKSQVIWLNNSDNPYFSLYEDKFSNKAAQIVGNLSFSYDFTKELNLTLRGAGSMLNGKDQQERAFGHLGTSASGVENKYGSFYLNKYSSSETNADFLLSYKKNIQDLSLKFSVGGNNMVTQGEYLNSLNEQLLVPSSYTMANHRRYPIVNSYLGPKKIINSLYSFANIGYKDLVYVDLTARNDWSSALPTNNNSYFYPSATLCFLMNNIFKLPSSINLWKLRTNYAMVGNDTDPGRMQMFYNFTTGTNGTAGISEENTYPELNLKPELTSAFELGSELSLLKNRLKLDFTYYNSITRNQIWAVQLSDVTGYTNAIKNAGKVKNWGFEVMVSGTPISVGKFSWNTSLNWSADRSSVLELDPANPDLKFTQQVAPFTYTIDQIGERRGQIYSRTARHFVYDPAVHDPSLAQYNGALYYDQAKDLPRVSELSVIGNVNPDWIAGWENTFKYKNWSLSALIIGVYGNSYYAGFEKKMMALGLDPITGGDRTKVLPTGVWDSPQGIRSFQPGDEIPSATYYGDYLVDGEINDIWVKNGTYYKLKEASLSYSLPSGVFKNSIIKGVTLTAVGRNLMSFSKVKYEDPEIFQGKAPGISTGNNVPLPRTWSFSLNVKF